MTPAGSATKAVPPFTACPPLELGGVLLLLEQATATMAATATTATPARRCMRLPRYICAPLSWRTGALVRLYRSCVQKPRRPGLGSPSRGGRGGLATSQGHARQGARFAWPLPPLSDTIEPAPLHALAEPQRASQRSLSTNDSLRA